MFRAKTVFVVGAGASVEVGLPMGSGLLGQIVEATNISFQHGRQIRGNHAIVAALRFVLNEGHEVDKLNEHLAAGWQLAASAEQALSIDNVIDALEDERVELIGKLGIVQSILQAEAASPFFQRDADEPNLLNLQPFDDTWYSSLTKLLTENVRKSQIGQVFDNLSVVNFNYDRCLEHYLPFSLSSYYGVDIEQIREVMQKFRVYRPYGVAGRLPWQRGDTPSVAFGQGSPQQVADIAQQVRTFTETVEEGDELAAMRTTIAEADRIVFLGFAFHRQNVELLSQRMQNHSEILATSYQISQSDISVIEDELRKSFSHEMMIKDSRIQFANMTCAGLFHNYWRTLTAEKGDHEPFSLPDISPRPFSLPNWPKLSN